MKLKTVLVAKSSACPRRVTLQIVTEAPAKFESADLRSRHKHTVDSAHKALRKNFHVQDIKIK